MPATTDERVDHNYLGGFWVAQQELESEATRLAPWVAENFDEKGFRAWARKTRPDVVITSASWAHRVIAWLKLEGWHVPRDVGVAVASIPFGDGLISGIDENVGAVGAMAVDIVVGMIQRNETGLPTTPWRMLAEGTWFQGRTVRRR
jgi:LacI family transcriptional regulator